MQDDIALRKSCLSKIAQFRAVVGLGTQVSGNATNQALAILESEKDVASHTNSIRAVA